MIRWNSVIWRGAWSYFLETKSPSFILPTLHFAIRNLFQDTQFQCIKPCYKPKTCCQILEPLHIKNPEIVVASTAQMMQRTYIILYSEFIIQFFTNSNFWQTIGLSRMNDPDT